MDLIPFGKYKGQPVEVLQNDKQYADWLTNQDWFRNRYNQINQIIINNFNKPSETPEHNAIQAKFTDKEYIKKVLDRAGSLKSLEINNVRFEYIYDVFIEAYINNRFRTVGIEIKPNLGDDYPAILRQIENCYVLNYREKETAGIKILVYENYTAESVTIEQIKKMFGEIRIVNIKDIV